MALRSLNNPIASFIDYLAKTGTDAAGEVILPSGLTATGGVISDYTDGSTVYRAHIFTSSGTFNVSSIGDYGTNIQYLLIGGGAGGSSGVAGGGGAGGFLTGTSFAVSTSPGSYTVTVGAGGVGEINNGGGTQGGNTTVTGIGTAGGGGYGGSQNAVALNTAPNPIAPLGNIMGSGGGGGGGTNAPAQQLPGAAGPSTFGTSNAGGAGVQNNSAGGGGGAGGDAIVTGKQIGRAHV